MTGFTFSNASRAVLCSLVPVVCPPEAHDLAAAIVDHMALTVGASPALLRRGIEAGLRTYDLGALLRHGRRARSLTGDAAERYFRSWERGPTPLHRQLAHAINQLMSLSCYEQPAMMDRRGHEEAADGLRRRRAPSGRADPRAGSAPPRAEEGARVRETRSDLISLRMADVRTKSGRFVVRATNVRDIDVAIRGHR